MHWADHTAQTLQNRDGSQVIASGITPSGEFHVGHLREILTAEMIHRACLDAGMESRYIFIVDSMDPLRRVYDFLSPAYQQYIGHPLAYIPAPGPDGAPDPDGGNYADHFLAPFLTALKEIGVEPEVVMNHQTYESGAFADKIHSSIEQKDEIRRVIEEVSGREVPEDWFPYNPLGSDGSIDTSILTFTGSTATVSREPQTSELRRASCPGGSIGLPNGESTASPVSQPARTTVRQEEVTTPEYQFARCWVASHLTS